MVWSDANRVAGSETEVRGYLEQPKIAMLYHGSAQQPCRHSARLRYPAGVAILGGAQSPRIDSVHRVARLIAAAMFACALISSVQAQAAVAYYFNWYCPGCSVIGRGSNGREGPFGSQSGCEAARAAMGGSLNLRGCGPDCFYPQLCQSEDIPDAPPAARQSPGFPPPSIHSPTAPSYDVGGRRRAEEAEREREQAQREAQARSRKETPPATRPDLALRWRNAFSWYEVRKSAQAIDIMLVETCTAADCSRKAYPNRPVFRGRLEGDRLIGVVPIHVAVESGQDSTRCVTPAGEFPIEGKLSDDGQSITWGKAEFPAQQGCRAPVLSLGTWRREP